MSPMLSSLLFPILASMFLAVNMGGSGTAPSFSAAYGSGILRKDLIPGLFGLFVLLGAVLAGKKVALTISRGIIPPETMTLTLTTVVLGSIGLALLAANLLRIPQSTTQATVFALAGPAIYFDVLETRHLLLHIVPAWLILPVASFVVAYLVGRFLYRPARRKWPATSRKRGWRPTVQWVVVATSCYVAFSIGSNNVANAAGPITAAVMNELGMSADADGFLIIMILSTLLIAPCFGIGSSVFGKGVIRTTGKELLELGPVGASIVSTITATLLLLTSVTRGIPTSLVQMNTGAIIGLGMSEMGVRGMLKDTPVLKLVRVWFAAPLVAMGLSLLGTWIFDRAGLL